MIRQYIYYLETGALGIFEEGLGFLEHLSWYVSTSFEGIGMPDKKCPQVVHVEHVGIMSKMLNMSLVLLT